MPELYLSDAEGYALNFDADEFFEQTGIDVRLAAPGVEPPLSSAGEHAQAQVLRQFALMHAAISMLEVAVRDHPSDDRLFDILDQSLGQRLADVREALIRLRHRRECQGAA